MLEENTIVFYCGHKVAINIAYNVVQDYWTKYIKIYWHFIKEKKSVAF